MMQTIAANDHLLEKTPTIHPGGFLPKSGVLSVLFLLMVSAVTAELHGERWRWSNPLPHGNNVLDMKVNGSAGLQVGDAGTIYVLSPDGRWAPAVTGVNNYLRSTTFFGERMVATGENGMILWSDDGVEFNEAQLSPPNTEDWFEGVTASGLRLAAVGDYGAIYLSTNGTEWTSAVSGTEEWLRGVAFGSGGFVAVGENGTILRSNTSGSSWNSVTSSTAEHLNRVRYLGSGSAGRFYAVGNGGTLLSSDTGTSWTSMNSGTTNHLYDVALNNAGLLLVGDEALLMSADDGTSWTDQINDLPTNAPPAWIYLSAHGKGDDWLVAGRTGFLMEGSCTNGSECVWQPSPTISSRAWLWDMTVQRGLYVAIGDLANIKTSLDGILWAREAVPVSQTNTVLLGVGGTSNLLVAVGSEGNVLVSEAGMVDIVVTNDASVTNITLQSLGVIWTNLSLFTERSLQGITADDELFIITGEAGSVFTSPDGTNWTERSAVTANFLSSVAVGGGTCIAVGDNGTLIRSVNEGVSWSSPVAMGTTDWLYRVRWIENQFVVVGENGSIYTSSDGITWNPRTSGTTRWLTDVTYIDGQWFVSGYQGTLLTSTNLADWSACPLPTGKSLFSAAAKDGQLMLAGVEGVLLRNQVLPVLSPVSILGYDYSVSTDTNGVESVNELFLFGGEPDQLFEFHSTTNLKEGIWTNLNGTLEMFDPSGTLYALRTRDATNTPPVEFYRTMLKP